MASQVWHSDSGERARVEAMHLRQRLGAGSLDVHRGNRTAPMTPTGRGSGSGAQTQDAQARRRRRSGREQDVAARDQLRRRVRVTTAAAGACPRGPGGCCRACRRRKPQGLVFRPSVSVPHLSRTAARPATGRAVGKNNRSAAVTLTGCRRRRCDTTPAAQPTLTAALARQPRHLVRPDLGPGREIGATSKSVKVYFDPRSAWQRPTNEQTTCCDAGCPKAPHRPGAAIIGPPQHHAPQALALSPQRLSCCDHR